jgi:hypothetical protein
VTHPQVGDAGEEAWRQGECAASLVAPAQARFGRVRDGPLLAIDRSKVNETAFAVAFRARKI